MPELEQIARIIDFIADVVYCLTQACMQTQTHYELKLHPTVNDYGIVRASVFCQQ